MPDDVKPKGAGERRRESARDRIEDHLRRLIAQGHGVTSPLPSEQKLADRFGVSRMTARGAYERLAGSGVLVRYPARGTFVAPHVVEQLMSRGRPTFFDQWKAQGFDVEVRILAYDVRPVPSDVRHEFDVPTGTPITFLKRLRLVGGLPLSLDRLYLPAPIHGLFSRGEFETSAVTQLLPKKGIMVGKGSTEIGARTAMAAEARALSLRSGDIVLVKRNLDLDTSGRPLIFEVSLSPAARVGYKFQIDFSLSPAEDDPPAMQRWPPQV